MMEWQTMDTAPKDGTEVWLAVWNNGEPGTKRLVERGFFYERWVEADLNEDGDNDPLYEPTHWMPFIIPAPPPI